MKCHIRIPGANPERSVTIWNGSAKSRHLSREYAVDEDVERATVESHGDMRPRIKWQRSASVYPTAIIVRESADPANKYGQVAKRNCARAENTFNSHLILDGPHNLFIDDDVFGAIQCRRKNPGIDGQCLRIQTGIIRNGYRILASIEREGASNLTVAKSSPRRWHRAVIGSLTIKGIIVGVPPANHSRLRRLRATRLALAGAAGVED